MNSTFNSSLDSKPWPGSVLKKKFGTLSAYDMKNNCSLFDRLLKNNNDIFLFGISFFDLEILTFFCYAN